MVPCVVLTHVKEPSAPIVKRRGSSRCSWLDWQHIAPQHLVNSYMMLKIRSHNSKTLSHSPCSKIPRFVSFVRRRVINTVIIVIIIINKYLGQFQVSDWSKPGHVWEC